MDDGTRARVQLYLRGERALGLTSLPVRLPQVVAPQVEAAARQPRQPQPKPAQPIADTPATPGQRSAKAPVTRPAPVAGSPSTALFGGAGGLMPPPSSEPFASPVLSIDEKRIRLSAIDENEVKGCTRCRLHETRTKTVFGEGDPDAKIFFIGEGPGENEDLSGRPFVGKAGQLLDKMIAGMGLRREDVFIANVVKCRPPGNRVPATDEVATCTPYLERQLEIVRPRVIVTLGLPATQYMLNRKDSMGRMRGQWHEWRGIKLMPTYHPSYVLRSYTEQVRATVWGDLKLVMAELGLKPKK